MFLGHFGETFPYSSPPWGDSSKLNRGKERSKLKEPFVVDLDVEKGSMVIYYGRFP